MQAPTTRKRPWQFGRLLALTGVLGGLALTTACKSLMTPGQSRGLYAEVYETRRTATDIKNDQGESHRRLNDLLVEMDKKLDDQDKLIREMKDDMQRQIRDLQDQMKKNQSTSYQAATTTLGETEAPPSLTPGAEELQLFNAAQAVVEAKNYDAAIAKLNQFLAQYPASSNAAKALYQLGRSYYALGRAQYEQNTIDESQRSFEESAKAFERIPSQYPASISIIPQALYAQAVVESKLRQYGKARETIDRLTQTYPDYEPAMVDAFLKQIGEEEATQEKPGNQ